MPALLSRWSDVGPADRSVRGAVVSDLIGAADRLARSRGHAGDCSFAGCTCGAVDEQKAALTDYWRLRKVAQGEQPATKEIPLRDKAGNVRIRQPARTGALS